ncbi:gas vesicle structural protein GvpA [Streptomyces sp. NPDC049577]|uniref:gas vesicle structural protein GvpA n=1 Tax=Streptomyces sp. NPDC049577 TaxID=3155153 RepID=UPI003445AA73
MTVVPEARAPGGGGGTSGLYDVLELILDRGLVIDAFVRVSLVGIEILKIDVRVVVASVDTYLRFAEACNRLDLESGPNRSPGLTEIVGDMTESGAHGKTKGALTGAAQSVADTFRQIRGDGQDTGGSKQPARRGGTRRKEEEAE